MTEGEYNLASFETWFEDDYYLTPSLSVHVSENNLHKFKVAIHLIEDNSADPPTPTLKNDYITIPNGTMDSPAVWWHVTINVC